MWKQGSIKVEGDIFKYWIKVFEEGSENGINQGRISKLQLNREDMKVCSYDRGWELEPVDENTEKALAVLLAAHN